MANKILIKKASTQGKTPSLGDLDLAELAINTYDGRLFAKKTVGLTSTIVDLTENDSITLSGDDIVTASGKTAITVNLSNTTVTAGAYGGASKTLSATVDAKGRLTALSESSIAITNTQISGLGTMSTQNANSVAITGGSIDGTAIGATTASTGRFTTIDTTGGVVIGGNLTVQGTTTTVNSTTVAIGDLNIELAKDAANKSQATGAGITVNLGTDGSATITYVSATDSWNLNQNTNVTGTLGVSGTATAGNLSTAGTLSVTGTATAGNLTTAGDLTANVSTLGATTATSLNATPIGAISPSTGAFTTLSASGNITASDSLSVTNTLTVKDLTITGVTSLSSLSSSSVAATQVVYGGTGGAFKGESDFTYNETTNTLSTGNLSLAANASIGGNLTVVDASIGGTLSTTGLASFTAAVSINSPATYTAGTYTTGALKLVGDGSIAGKLQVQGTITKGGFDVLNTADTIDGGTF